jgi:hypothetical protein
MAAGNRQWYIDCELFVRPADSPNRYLQTQGKFNDTELDAVLPSWATAREAASLCLDLEKDILWSRRIRVRLKNQKRATIVGETTGGGAHPVSGHQVGDYFMIGVPFAKSLDPVTKTNWEGTGVEPDVKFSGRRGAHHRREVGQ